MPLAQKLIKKKARKKLPVQGPDINRKGHNTSIAGGSGKAGTLITPKIDVTKISDIIPIYQNKEWLEEQYIGNHLSMNKIADLCGCHNLMIRKWIKKYNIPVRSRSDAVSGEYNPFYGKKHTEETCELLSERLSGENNPNFGKPMTAKQKQKISDTKKGKYCGEKNPFYGKKHTEETRKKISASRKGKLTGPDNPIYGTTRSQETKNKISEKSKLWWSNNRNDIMKTYNSSEFKKNMSDKAKINWMIGTYSERPMHTSGRCGWYSNNSGKRIYLKSSYETRVAKKLDELGIEWLYEPHIFKLSNGTSYRPDFYLPEFDIWWETKGWMNSNTINKMKLFYEEYKDIHLLILWKHDIISFENFPADFSIYDLLNIGDENLNAAKN